MAEQEVRTRLRYLEQAWNDDGAALAALFHAEGRLLTPSGVYPPARVAEAFAPHSYGVLVIERIVLLSDTAAYTFIKRRRASEGVPDQYCGIFWTRPAERPWLIWLLHWQPGVSVNRTAP